MRLLILLLVTLLLATLSGCARTNSAANRSVPVSVIIPKDGPRFVDVAAAAGIAYRWEIAGKRPLNILQTIGNGCAFLDYDNDGSLDILLVGNKLALYRGDGRGHFSDVTAAVGLGGLSAQFLGCAVGDYDNDGFDDVYISGYRTGRLLHNEAGRSFTDITEAAGLSPQPWGTSCAFGDVDNDGRLDLYVGNYLKFGPDSRFQLCNYDGVLTGCGPDYYEPEKGVLYRNLGGGRFNDSTSTFGAADVSGKALGVTFVDFDGTGHASLAIANDKVPGDLLCGNGGRLQNVGATSGIAYRRDGNVQAGMGMDWGDYDNDGKLDLAVATFENETKPVYRNLGSGLFDDYSGRLGIYERTVANLAFGVKWMDFDNDGWLDLMMTNGHTSDNVADWMPGHTYRQCVQLFHGEQGSRFTEVSGDAGACFAAPIVGRGLAVGDYDNDGRVDALVVDSEGAPLLLHNETTRPGHWISLSLEGVKSNRDGIGATVRVTAGGRTITRQCHTDGSYLSASDKRVHVGIGDALTANVTVRWPSGARTSYTGLAADRVVRLREDASTGKPSDKRARP